MRMTVIKNDGFVAIDGQGFGNLDLSFLPSNIRAFQWYETFGEIEFNKEIANQQFITPPNEIVSDEPVWFEQVISAWNFGLEQLNQLNSKIAEEVAAALQAQQNVQNP